MFDDETFHVFRDKNYMKEKQKVNRTELPRRARNFSKDQLKLALQKKKACNAKAQKIVQSMLEPVEDVEHFLLMLRDINQSHFEDVIVERAIDRLCGYPLCEKKLENIPSQQFVISLSKKKVYDITERKNFCSGDCFKSANYIKGQMLTSPLWLRNQEDIPKFRLLSDGESLNSGGENTFMSSMNSISPINVDELKIVEKNTNTKVEVLPDCIQKQESKNAHEDSDLLAEGSDDGVECEEDKLATGMTALSLQN
ncbi:putative RNA polymerase II subunit B1 CTD phosphatase RPAP2 homolog [Toxorhynchites rutilus septentrionalis]|uniref:putative RNA polymerase II subunit B1 CTD phosphatase RPAP2 homolog n=1 Tax=Toxorhynchites rutilus septentrionalis TaxID=329112 RepID=UPI002479B46F|nr:putative RNA polymerase II subunit B1 CTD phosphatase RPAP2 homolog [Toxorhynchites rutilus septentrionalis]